MSFLKISDPVKRDLIIKEYLETKNNIQDDMISERTGEQQLQTDLSKFFKPITETWITLPKELVDKKAIINMQNKDNKCFLWCILRALNPDKNNPQRLDKKLMGKENTLNMEGIDYPVSFKDLNKFEKQKPTISITVLGHERKVVYPLRNSTNTDTDHNLILMLIEKVGVNHYCLKILVVYCHHKSLIIMENTIFVWGV